MPASTQPKSSYAISIALHLILLLLLSLIFYRPTKLPNWHEFEWFTDATKEEMLPAALQNIGSNTPNTDAATHSGQPVAAKPNAAVKPITSPMIETPVLGEADGASSAVAPTDNSALVGHLQNLGEAVTSSGNAYGYNASLVSGSSEAFIIKQNPPKIRPIMDDEVQIEFRLSESGRVLMNTVSVLTYKQSLHWEAIRAEMPAWRFGFKAKYNADRIYRIRVVFRVN